MKRYPGIFIISSVALAMMAISAAPASAGQRERRSTQSQQDSRQGSSERRAAPQDRRAQPQAQVQPRQTQPQTRQVQPRQTDRQVQPRQMDRQIQPRQIQPRLSDRQIAPDRRGTSQFQSRAIPRQQVYGSQRYQTYDRNRYDGYSRYGNYGPSRFAILPRGHEYFSRYYTFRPRLSLGFGLYVGYPVPFPRWYDSYWYSNYGYNFSAAPYGGYNSVGGLSFDIAQSDAELWIDGEYVGFADDFSPSEPPLTLSAGVHHVELEAPGYQPMQFDITVVPGQVIPYQGSLSR